MAITRMEGVQPRNELELTKRDLERLQVLGPFIELFETEFIGKILPRKIFNIMLRRKMLLPLPKSLQGVPLKINYVSIMKLAQNATASVSLKDVLQTAGLMDAAAHSSGLAAAVAHHRPRRDAEGIRRTQRVFHAKLWLPEETVQRNDAAAAKAAQGAGQRRRADGARRPCGRCKASKTLSDTPLGGNTALSALAGQQPANAA